MHDKKDKNQEGYSLVSNSAATVQTSECGRKYRNLEGMGWLVTCLFIVGETAGGGLIDSAGEMARVQKPLPKAVPRDGSSGSWPQIHVAAKNIENFLRAYAGIHFGFCQLLLLVAALMLPFTMLKSPKDFWWAVIGAMVTTTVAVSMILYATAADLPVCAPEARYPPIGVFHEFWHCDVRLRRPWRLPDHTARHAEAVPLPPFVIFCMYLPVSVLGYLAYGDSLQDSIIPSLQDPVLQQTVNLLITLHVFLALTIVFNPLNQEMEELLDVPQEFGLQRILSRTAMMLAVVAVAETVPNFGVLLDLVGGSTITMMTLGFPTVFNLFLCAGHAKHNASIAGPSEKPLALMEVWHFTSRPKMLLNSAILVFALVGGTAATVSAMNAMLSSELSAPCYAGILDVFTKEPVGHKVSDLEISVQQFFCCGQFRNVSRLGEATQCLGPGQRLIGGKGGHG
uniref:Aa_trans domain-containing protein n=1 Tax=Globodera pallida TaxID=36090 RepID=A0A183BKK5_GLOPA